MQNEGKTFLDGVERWYWYTIKAIRPSVCPSTYVYKDWYRLAHRGSNATRNAHGSVHVHEVWTGCKHELHTTRGNAPNHTANHLPSVFTPSTKEFAAQLRRVCGTV